MRQIATDNTMNKQVTPAVARRFQELLRDHRMRLGKTQTEIAEEIGVSQSLISTLERGPHVGMRVFDLFKVLEYYRIEPNEIAAVLGFQVKGDQPAEADKLTGLWRTIANLPPEKTEQVEEFLDIFLRGLNVQ